ncbi:alpha/beta fold hydrolase [Ferrimonas senticii]|uniref:alpha/beta fold hydrolase n=1 Tax=Ferrimonas senticii TaxID=394566 RepID=UPI0004296F99|nr:alpha/beta hydrolase [Ferrimonas senticii]
MTSVATLAPPTPRQYQLDGLNIAAQHWGNDDAPMLLAVHGWLDNSESFAPLAPYLVAAGYQLLAIDWPGHGHSDHRGVGASYPFLDYLYELHQLMLQLPSAPVCLIGHSMGGILASLYLASYPQQCSALVSIEALGPLTQTPEQTAKQFRQGIESRIKGRRPDDNLQLARLVAARKALTDLPEALLEPLLLRNLQPGDNGYRWRSDPRLRQRSLLLMSDQQAQQWLSELTVPTLILLAEQGFSTLKQAWPSRQSWFSQGTRIDVAGGHHCHMTHPQQTATAIIEFLARH